MQKDYDMWFNWKVTNQCNLTCEYCCASFSRDFDKVSGIKKVGKILGEINRKKKTLLKSGLSNHWKAFKRLTQRQPEKTPAIRVDELLASLDKTSKILFSGGEPLLVSNIIEAAQTLTERHYVGFVTNLTLSKRLRLLFDTVSPDRVVELTASFHIDELERRDMVETFIENCLAGQERGFDIDVVVVAYPALFEKILHYKKVLGDRGIELQAMPFIGEYDGHAYPDAYPEEEIDALELGRRQEDLAEECHGRFCNTGYNAFAAFPDGSIERCFTVSEKMGNLYDEIHAYDTPRPCPLKYCKCAMWACDDMLYQKAQDCSPTLVGSK